MVNPVAETVGVLLELENPGRVLSNLRLIRDAWTAASGRWLETHDQMSTVSGDKRLQIDGQDPEGAGLSFTFSN